MKDHSVSSLSLYTECPAKYAIRYTHNIQEEDRYPDSRDRGSCVHEGLDAALRESMSSSDPEHLTAVAVKAAIWYAEHNTVSDSAITEALEALRYYVPLLKFGTEITPYLHKGKPVVEFEFKTKFKNYGVSLQGRIDAVVNMNDQVVLLDWKVRGNNTKFYTESVVEMDKQLYVYAGVLRHVYGIKIDAIAQVQLSADLPGRLRVKKGKTGEAVDDFDSRLSRTTSAVFAQDLLNYPESVRESLTLVYFDKIVDDEYFLKFTYAPVDRVRQALHYAVSTAKKIEEDTEYLPIMNAYVCKFCPVMGHCKRIYFGV